MTMKSVLISIRPKWCEKIANGEKTIEVRKTRPKLETPFKCYIYCAKVKSPKDVLYLAERVDGEYIGDYLANGKVVGEFVCDWIYQYASDLFRSGPVEGADISTDEMVSLSCLTAKELYAYEHSAEVRENCIYLVGVYGWHISDLKVYDQPKEVSEFSAVCRYKNDDGTCPAKKVECFYQQFDHNQDGSINLVECGKKIERPPQSWCYVEEV
ncbi:MAG: hypothetical protein IJA67_10560 [Oscillospiraceae bacterium]|nr:hypothetical protein [Oscillospiraceae bacterium]